MFVCQILKLQIMDAQENLHLEGLHVAMVVGVEVVVVVVVVVREDRVLLFLVVVVEGVMVVDEV